MCLGLDVQLVDRQVFFQYKSDIESRRHEEYDDDGDDDDDSSNGTGDCLPAIWRIDSDDNDNCDESFESFCERIEREPFFIIKVEKTQ